MLIILQIIIVLVASHSNAVQQIKSPLVKLNDGNEIPIVGLGTSRMTDSQANITVKEAINSGYRHIDTAYFYKNEKGIGTALKDLIAQNRIKREDVFITSKVWSNFHSRPLVVEGLKISLKNLGLEYLDLALVHYPTGFKEGNDLFPKFRNGSIIPRTWKKDAYLETWKGMEDALKLGLAKSIGVSNFNSVQLKRVLDVAEIKPVVNQVESHPYLNQQKLINFCQNNGVEVVGYSPFGRANRELLNDPVLKQIAAKHNKTVPQVILRWQIQRRVIVIPKTTRKSRMDENMNVFDFEISEEDLQKICRINKNKRIFDIPGIQTHPDYPFAIPY